jgi:hypothetical protein
MANPLLRLVERLKVKRRDKAIRSAIHVGCSDTLLAIEGIVNFLAVGHKIIGKVLRLAHWNKLTGAADATAQVHAKRCGLPRTR